MRVKGWDDELFLRRIMSMAVQIRTEDLWDRLKEHIEINLVRRKYGEEEYIKFLNEEKAKAEKIIE